LPSKTIVATMSLRSVVDSRRSRESRGSTPKRAGIRPAPVIFCPEGARSSVFECLKPLLHRNFVDSRAAVELPAVEGALFLLLTPRSAGILANELFSRGLASWSDNVKHLLFVTTCALIKVQL
jgi:hypothetical protein